jgi:hypothetical protein
MRTPKKSPASDWIVASTTRSVSKGKLSRKAGAPWIAPDAAVVAKVAADADFLLDAASVGTPANNGITSDSHHPRQIATTPNPPSTYQPAGERRARNSIAMPNHVTNKVSAPAHILKSLINESGKIDFNTILPFRGQFDWNGIDCAAEEAAQVITAQPLNDHPIIASLQQSNRSRVDALQLSDEGFEQFIQMLRNKRSCGHLNTMDFARDVWGTKWNAYDQVIDLDAGELSFDTAWSCPMPVLTELSKRHPDHEITVRYADEDLGSNCGTVRLKAGSTVCSDVASRWDEMSERDQQKWAAWARDLKGWPESDEDEDE